MFNSSYPLPTHLAHREILSAIVIGYPLDINQREALQEVGAMLFLKCEPAKILDYDSNKRVTKLPDLVCLWHGLPLEQIQVARAAFGIDRVLVSRCEVCLIEMLITRHPSARMRRLRGRNPQKES